MRPAAGRGQRKWPGEQARGPNRSQSTQCGPEKSWPGSSAAPLILQDAVALSCECPGHDRRTLLPGRADQGNGPLRPSDKSGAVLTASGLMAMPPRALKSP